MKLIEKCGLNSININGEDLYLSSQLFEALTFPFGVAAHDEAEGGIKV